MFSTPVLTLPDEVFVPIVGQSPVATHDVGLFVEDQVIVELDPTNIELGVTLSDTEGGAGTTVMSTAELFVPVSLLHESVNVYDLTELDAPVANGPTDSCPDVPFDPDQSPLPVHEVGLFAVLQLSVTEAPDNTVVSPI